MDQPTVTSQIYAQIFKLLEQNPTGIHWSELLKTITGLYPQFHPKTVNGLIWKLTQKFPDQVIKPSPGLFRLKKYTAV